MIERFLFIVAVLIIGPTASATAQSDDEMRMLSQRIVALDRAGKHVDAIPLADQYARWARGRFGGEHAHYAVALHALASLYTRAGRSAEAEPFARQSLMTREKALGPNHPSVADSLMLLADIDRLHGRKAEQEVRARRALAIREKSLGREHLLVADALIHLFTLCDARSECATEAEDAQKRVIAIREKTLGPGNRLTLLSQFALATHYWRVGKLRDAETIYVEGIAQWERLFANEQAALAGWLHGLGEVFRLQGRLDEAERIHRRGLALMRSSAQPTGTSV